ncbi:MAG: AAA family ATPase [Bacteroidales bacterium]|jgi:hypothetical protein
MRTDIYKPDTSKKDDRGNFILIYGDSGVGKSATVIQTAQDPIYWIVAERGQIDLTVKAINRPDIKLKVGYYEGWDDLLETIYDIKNFEKIKTVLFDGLTHVMNVHLADEILEENYESRDKKNDKSEKDMTMRVKGTPEMYGVLSKQMTRLMKGFEQLTIAGIDVICTARTQDSPKWNRELSCAPALAGKEFPRDMKGFFDMIGLVERNVIDGQVKYPPLVSFEDDGSFLSKFTGLRPEGGVRRKPFNIKKILDFAHGRK